MVMLLQLVHVLKHALVQTSAQNALYRNEFSGNLASACISLLLCCSVSHRKEYMGTHEVRVVSTREVRLRPMPQPKAAREDMDQPTVT